MSHFQRVLMVVALLISVFVVCSFVSGAEPLSFKDQYGRLVTIPTFPTRIVSGTPSNTEILIQLGLVDRIVGVTNWCNYPEVQSKAKVGDINPLNLEAIVALQPDLVLAHQLNGKEIVDALDDLKIPVAAMQPTTLKTMMESVSLIGAMTGVSDQAEELVAKMQVRKERIERVGSSLQEKDLTVLFLLGIYDSIWTAGPGSFIHEAIEMVGARNTAEDAISPWAEISVETIITKDPDVILLGADAKAFLGDPKWQVLSAVQKNRVFQIDDDVFHRATPRIFDGIERMLEIMTGLE